MGKSKLITLPEAERRGHGKASTLRYNCARGNLTCEKPGQDWLTTEKWLEAWRAGKENPRS